MVSYIEQATENIIKTVDAIRKDPKIPQRNKKAAEEYAKSMKAKGLTDRSISKNLYCLAVFLKAIGKKDIFRLRKRDMEDALSIIESSKYSNKTKQNIKVTIKSFYKHFVGNDIRYPDEVAWIRTTLGASKKVLPEDILTENDVLRMLGASNNLRDKAIIALLFDAGIRIGELLNLKLKEIDLNSEPAHIIVQGKTGMRKIPIIFSVPYIANYINTIKEPTPEGSLLHGEGSWSKVKQKVDYGAVRMMIKRVAETAGIKKRVYPHLFRHSRATYYANKLTEQQLKVFMGWTSDSRQASTYVHLSGRDIDNAVLQAHGMKPQENAAESVLTVKTCPKCRQPNPAEALYCTRCGSPLDIRVAMQTGELLKKAREALLESVKDPEVKKEIVKALKEEEKKEK